MADITKCEGENCKLKETCYRFTAKESEFNQSYFFKPPIKENEKCDYYLEIKTK